MMDWDKASAELRKKLNPAHVKPPAKFGPKGDYIEGWLAIDEANRIFGFGAWSYEVRAVTCVAEKPRGIGREQKPGFGVTYTAHVRVIVGDVVREDFGAGHGYDVDLGLAHESAIKEAVTDSLKRALRTFGNPFGLALYDKTRENVGVDEPPTRPTTPPKDTRPLAEQMGPQPSARQPAPPVPIAMVRGALLEKLDHADSLAKLEQMTALKSFEGALERLRAEDREGWMEVCGRIEAQREALRPPMPDDDIPGLESNGTPIIYGEHRLDMPEAFR